MDTELVEDIVLMASAADLDAGQAADIGKLLREAFERLPADSPKRGSYARSVSTSFAREDVDLIVDAELRGLVNDAAEASGLRPGDVHDLMVHELNEHFALVVDGQDELAPSNRGTGKTASAVSMLRTLLPDYVGRQFLTRLARLEREFQEPREVLKAFLLRLTERVRRADSARQSAVQSVRLARRSAATSSDEPPGRIVLSSGRVPRAPNAHRMTLNTLVIGVELAAAA